MRVLVISPVFPWPLNMGNRVRIHGLVRELSRSHTVHVLCMLSSDLRANDVVDAQSRYSSLGVQLTIVPRPNRGLPRRVILKCLRLVLNRVVGLTEAEFYYGLPGFNDSVRTQLAFGGFDCAIVNYWFTAQRAIRSSPIPVVCDTHDVIVEQLAREGGEPGIDLSSALRASPRLARLARREARQLSHMDWLICVHDKDRETLASVLGVSTSSTAIAHVRDEAQLAYSDPRHRPPVALFYGAMQSPMNQRAASILASEVWPRVRQANPVAELWVAGSHLDHDLRGLFEQLPGASVLGFVNDIGWLIRSAGVVVMPLDIGSGLKGRVLESMAVGTPIVGTPLAFEGLAVRNGREVLCRDTWPSFADAVVEVLGDTDLRVSLAEKARAVVNSEYSWEAQYGRLNGVLESARRRRVTASDE